MLQHGTDLNTTQDILFLLGRVVMLSGLSESFQHGGLLNVWRLRFVLIILSSVSSFIFYLYARSFVYFCFECIVFFSGTLIGSQHSWHRTINYFYPAFWWECLWCILLNQVSKTWFWWIIPFWRTCLRKLWLCRF